MKTAFKIIGSILAISAVVIVIIIFNKQKPPIPETITPITQTESVVPVATIPENQEMCFSKNSNGDITEAKLTINNANVTGTFNWIPFEKDSARGTLSGTVAANGEMNLLYDYMIEGAHQTEEKIMKIEDGKLLIKHGELLDPKYDGHLVYKEKTSAVYSETLEACK
jgi:hypothetical protein